MCCSWIEIIGEYWREAPFSLTNAPWQVWDILDTQNYCLPQRRNRVWGLAWLLTGQQAELEVGAEFSNTVRSLRTNWHFPFRLIFKNLRQQQPTKRHSELIAAAHSKCPRTENLFVDCASSKERLTFGEGVLPCLTPSHGIYSTSLKRYLEKEDFLNAQGLWPSCFTEPAYNLLLSMDSQNVAGNSFSSTVCLAVALSSLTCVPETWALLPDQDTSKVPGSALRRLKRKQPAPEYDCVSQPVKKKQVKMQERKKRPRYTRKVAGKDSRCHAPGKRVSATLWDKEHVILGRM